MKFATPFLGFCCAAMLAAGPAPALLDKPASALGPVIIQTYAEGTFFHLKATATSTELPGKMQQLVPVLMKSLAAGQIGTLGPLHVVFHGLTSDPTKIFDLEIGVLVPKGTPAVGDCQVRTLPAFTCASTVFTGSFAQVDTAYSTIFPTLAASGRVPNGEFRQMVFFYEGLASTNNALLVQVGLQPMK